MSAPVSHHPLVVNTADGSCWTRRAVTSDGRGLYALAGSVAGVPDEVLVSLAELAELGITGSAFALPVPVGPPSFPPPPRTELERLAAQVVELQETASEAGRDAARARRERDLMRERVSEPNGCAHCGVVQRSHGRRYVSGVGGHAWERPSDEQVKARMLARRVARMPLDMAPQPSAEARRNLYAKALYEFVNGAFVWEASDDQDSWLTEADAAIVVADAEQAKLRARVAELETERHSTNEALDDAVQALRADRAEPVRGPSAAESADRLTRLFAPTQALREDGTRASFFQPGHLYAARVGRPGGRERFRFRCESVTTAPETGTLRALGQHGRRTIDGEWAWTPNPRTYDDWRSGAWTDITNEDPHDGPLAHSYRVGRDLPETGGTR